MERAHDINGLTFQIIHEEGSFGMKVMVLVGKSGTIHNSEIKLERISRINPKSWIIYTRGMVPNTIVLLTYYNGIRKL